MEFYKNKYTDTPQNIADLEQECRECNYSVNDYIPTALSAFLKDKGKWKKKSDFMNKSVRFTIKLTVPVGVAWDNLIARFTELGYQRIGFVLLRSMMMYVIVNQNQRVIAHDAKAVKVGKVMPDSRALNVCIPESVLADFKNLCQKDDISVNQYVTYLAYVMTLNSDLLLQIFAKNAGTSTAEKMRIFCNRIFGLESEVSLECMTFSGKIYSYRIAKADMERVVKLGSDLDIEQSRLVRCIVRCAVRNHLVKSRIESKAVEQATETVARMHESDDNMRLSIRIPLQLREDFKTYCRSKYLTAANLIKLFIGSLGNQQLIENVMKSRCDANCDSNLSIHIGKSDLEKLKVYAAAIGCPYAMILRRFMVYSLSDGFDWTRLED